MECIAREMHYLCPNTEWIIYPLQVKCVIILQSLHQAILCFNQSDKYKWTHNCSH